MKSLHSDFVNFRQKERTSPKSNLDSQSHIMQRNMIAPEKAGNEELEVNQSIFQASFKVEASESLR